MQQRDVRVTESTPIDSLQTAFLHAVRSAFFPRLSAAKGRPWFLANTCV
jgi:hypothetical protein